MKTVREGRRQRSQLRRRYTLLAIAAPVLGGRGSLFGCVLGALVLAMTNTIVPMLGISAAWSFMIVGVLSVLALLAYSRGNQNPALAGLLRRVRR